MADVKATGGTFQLAAPLWPAGPGWLACAETLACIPTPTVTIDRTVVRRNVEAASQIAHAGRVTLSPHVKTHKTLRIAEMQMRMGASGLTAAKPSEAAVFLRAGFPVVTVAYPVLRSEALTLLLSAAAQGGGQVRFVIDSDIGLDVLSSTAQQQGLRLPVFMEVDTGLRRCGVLPSTQEALGLAMRVDRTSGLDFLGVFSHAGQAYAAKGPEGVHAIAAQERRDILALTDALMAVGLTVRERSVGCTPTVFLNDGFDGLTEIRPGNYVFMDLVQIALGVAEPADVALQILATVVSANHDFAITDAGSKVLSSDKAPHGSDTLDGYGIAVSLSGDRVATVAKLSEEHGFVVQPREKPFAVGERLRILPNHACPVVNLVSDLLVLHETGASERWSVDARGMVMSDFSYSD